MAATLHPPSASLLDVLRKLHPQAIDLSLDRLEVLLRRLGSPESKLPPVVHVAGTNGKGSTIAFVRAGLESFGARVHAYTSPHLVSFHERIRIASEIISEPDLSQMLIDVLQANRGESITFFEATTAAALLAFSRAPADYTLVEVGMGGRLDATNVAGLAPLVCAITPISLDHQDFLGHTIEAIATEKAGILKRNVPAVIARQPAGAMSAIRARALAVGAPLHVCGEDWHIAPDGEGLLYRDSKGEVRLPRPRHLLGDHQLENAGVAIAVLRLLLGRSVRDAAVEGAMLRAQWPARLERLYPPGPLATAALKGGAELWLDGGHNPAAGVALAAALTAMEPKATVVFVVGMLRTKDVGGFLTPLRALGRTLHAVPIPSEGSLALTAAEMAAAANAAGFDVHEAASPLSAIEAAVDQKGASGGGAMRVVICGSLYLAGWVLQSQAETEQLTQRPLASSRL